MKAYLVLENEMVFKGTAFGSVKESIGEVVFNTGMAGYQEVLTDPSYCGQIVTMTYPLIGNYGLNSYDYESKVPRVKGFIVREKADAPSHFQLEETLDAYLKRHDIVGLEGIDTRALTKVLRNKGTMRGAIVISEEAPNVKQVLDQLTTLDNTKVVAQVTTPETRIVKKEGAKHHIAMMDFGMKENIVRSFEARDCSMTIFPAYTKAEEILALNPDGIFLSNGPGDPEDLPEVIGEVKKLTTEKPIFGICLGHQLLCLALGGKTERLKYGHRGCNHPVKDLLKDKVYITSQNHGYVVKQDAIPEDVEVTHVNLNDNSIEGMRHKKLPIFSVQFHPEAAPGPEETEYLFDEFINVMEGNKHA